MGVESVLMVCPQFRPIVGGAERQAEKLSKVLARRGVRVTVLTPRLVSDTPDREENEGVVVHRFPLIDLCKRSLGVRGLGPINLLSIRYQVMIAVTNHLKDVNVVHAHIASPLTAFAMQAAQKLRIPILCKVAMGGERTDLNELSNIGIGGSYLVKALVRDMDRWIATTQAVQQSLIDWGVPPEKTVAIPNGVHLECDHSPHNKQGMVRRFFYLGRLSSNIQRDVPTLIRAFDRMADIIPDVELALVGDGDLYQATVALVDQARNRERIQVPGCRQPEPWLLWADCFVLPSRREGLSNALLEAMSHGLPCIANDIPQNREVLEGGAAGILVPVEDEDRLHEELVRMATVPGLAEEYGVAASRRVRACYSIDAVADKYIELYNQIIGDA